QLRANHEEISSLQNQLSIKQDKELKELNNQVNQMEIEIESKDKRIEKLKQD
ncbi:19117_t:CDS:2, partial [Racocetra persica]